MKELCRRIGISDATLYHWKAKYGALEVNEAQRLRPLEDENGRLKKIVTQQTLHIDALARRAASSILNREHPIIQSTQGMQ